MLAPIRAVDRDAPRPDVAGIIELVAQLVVETKVSLLAVLEIVPPSGGTKVSVSPLWKLLPLISIVWLLFEEA